MTVTRVGWAATKWAISREHRPILSVWKRSQQQRTQKKIPKNTSGEGNEGSYKTCQAYEGYEGVKYITHKEVTARWWARSRCTPSGTWWGSPTPGWRCDRNGGNPLRYTWSGNLLIWNATCSFGGGQHSSKIKLAGAYLREEGFASWGVHSYWGDFYFETYFSFCITPINSGCVIGDVLLLKKVDTQLLTWTIEIPAYVFFWVEELGGSGALRATFFCPSHEQYLKQIRLPLIVDLSSEVFKMRMRRWEWFFYTNWSLWRCDLYLTLSEGSEYVQSDKKAAGEYNQLPDDKHTIGCKPKTHIFIRGCFFMAI